MSKKKMSKKKKLHILLWIVAVLVIAGAAGYTLFIKPMMEQEEIVYRENTIWHPSEWCDREWYGRIWCNFPGV